MANIETQIVNFYESTLASLLASGATSTTVATAPTTNGTTVINASGGSPIYLVIDPDNSGSREVVSVTTSSGTTLSAITRDLENRHGGTPPDHQIGTTIRLAVLAEQEANRLLAREKSKLAKQEAARLEAAETKIAALEG